MESYVRGASMGDICSLMSMAQGYVGGAEGAEHGVDYRIGHPETVCVDSAKVQMLVVRLLLENDAAGERCRPCPQNQRRLQACSFLQGGLFRLCEQLCRKYDAVRYAENGDVVLQVDQ